MKRPLTIGKQISLSFCAILALLLLIGLFAEFGVRRIVNNAEQLIAGNRFDGFLAQMEVDHLNWSNSINTQLNDIQIESISSGTGPISCALGHWLADSERRALQTSHPSLFPLLEDLDKIDAQLHASAVEAAQVFKWADPNLPARFVAIEAEHLRWLGRLRAAVLENDRELRGVQTDPEQCSFGKWRRTTEGLNAYQKSGNALRDTWDELADVHDPMHRMAVRLEQILAAGNFDKAREFTEEQIAPRVDEATSLFRELANQAEDELAGIRKARAIYAKRTLPALSELQARLVTLRQTVRSMQVSDEALVVSARNTRLSAILTTLVTLLAGALLAFAVQRGISRALVRLTNQVEVGADQTATAVEEVAAASGSLADGAAQQAAATEEISSSLEEVASMTRDDADSARQADTLMREAARVVAYADLSMQRLTESIQDITTASEATKKIVKTIDEIAFQTNLLALNAAVEAARAGEAGAGFAVVADEVRNLALRAADSAKNTSELIDNTVAKIGTGADLVAATSESFTLVAEATGKISDLISRIANSTGEQAIAIQHVNKGVINIDTVTQQTVATAEEVAAAAEQLRAQADAAREVVRELVAMVGGQGNPGSARRRVSALPPPSGQSQVKTGIVSQQLAATAGQRPEDF